VRLHRGSAGLGGLALRAVGGREFDDPAIVAQLRGLLHL